MSDELPPLWALDVAAKAAGLPDWFAADRIASLIERASIIAHARSLAKYEKPPVDEAELKRRQDAREAECTRLITRGWDEIDLEKFRDGRVDTVACIQSAYIALCRRDGVTPTPVEEWGQ